MNAYIAGVDEAGRGPIAGPVYAAAVILPQNYDLPLLRDSKKLSAIVRANLYDLIREQSLAYSIAYANVEEITQLNILQASLLAMRRAVLGLCLTPKEVWIDGIHAPNLEGLCITKTFVKGDDKYACISASSILAKHARDMVMIDLDAKYPEYGFAKHKGYPTAQHLRRLATYGKLPTIHRDGFAPVVACNLVNQPNI
jgi:ribonuclease HII